MKNQHGVSVAVDNSIKSCTGVFFQKKSQIPKFIANDLEPLVSTERKDLFD